MAEHPDLHTPPSVAAATPLVVGIGASAGGIEALTQFFQHVPARSGAAYVVILHLSPDHDSRLAEVLQRTARIPVTRVTERVTILHDHAYVVPPNRMLSVEKQSIVVSDVTLLEQRRSPIDLFFRSLADAQGAAAVAVVLSGTGADGSLGLKRVKEYGGLTIAQTPDEAGHREMPQNAIATGHVDFVLPVAEMPGRIQGHGERSREDDGGAAVHTPSEDADALRNILTVLRIRTGHDFSQYKPGTIQRRIQRRVHVRNVPSMAAYARAVRQNPDESVALMKEILISVTSFFRDPPAFDALAHRVIPAIFLSKRAQDQLRVWVPACATGEEAYSIGILIAEHAAELLEQPALQIFATDLDEGAVAAGREGLYTDADVADLSKERLERFFTRDGVGYRVRRELRETVLFAHHNVVRDPPFSHLDLIACRNLLIYLNRQVQERVIETFHFALRPGGYLFLGGSETPAGTSDLFAVADKNAHIYESRTVTSRLPAAVREPAPIVTRPPVRMPEPRPQERISPAELHLQLLEQYAPPSIVVTDEHTIVHMSERAGRYLQVAGGEPTRDLLRLVRPDLRPHLRSALYQALRDRRVAKIGGVAVSLEEGERRVDLAVHPVLRDGDPARGYLLVTFDERDALRADEAETGTIADTPEAHALQLEEELTRLKQQLRTSVEQYETQVEEAKASNEELQAMNEELRSAAEELETSKEELQSVNEELITVNQELKLKLEELELTNNDFQNLLNSRDIGTIFLDRELRLKLATPSASRIFNLRPGDLGRPLSDITTQLMYRDLYNDVRQVISDLHTTDREIQTHAGEWMLVGIRPYRTQDDRIDGVVITFQDITDRRLAEERMRQGEERLRLLIDSATDYAIFTMSAGGVVEFWNSGAERMFGYTGDEIVGRNFELLFTPEDRQARVPARELEQASSVGRAADERFHIRKDGSRFYCSGTTMRLGKGLGLAKIARDLSAQREAAASHYQVTHLLKRLVTAQEDERARIARDLHDQLGQQLTAMRLSLERHRNLLATAGAADDDIQRALTLADRLNRDLDFLAWELRPAVLDDLGLAAALPLFVREWSAHYRVAAEYQSRAFAAGRLCRDAEVVFYRVAQEALTNIAKHAHASRVDVMLEAGNRSVVLVVEDDGVGFDSDDPVRARGIGLLGMQERASLIGATLQVESKPGEGTAIFLRCESLDVAAPGPGE